MKTTILFFIVILLAFCQSNELNFKETIQQNETVIKLSKQKQQEIKGYFTAPRTAIFGNYLKLRPYYQRIKWVEKVSDSLLLSIDQLRMNANESKPVQLRNCDLKQ
jgi:hypothetical protein